MFDGRPYREELQRRVSTIRRILDAAEVPLTPTAGIDVSREARGLAVLLLFAAYENLLTSLCRGLLERAAMLRVGNRRLRTGFRQFAIQNYFESIANSAESKVWQKTGRELLECAFETRKCTIDTNKFPSDGSFMRRSQVTLVFDIFDLGDPGSILKEVWPRLDTIVIQRNKIAHGTVSPEEVGRNYTHGEMRGLVEKWEMRWTEVIDHIEAKASIRDFYRY